MDDVPTATLPHRYSQEEIDVELAEMRKQLEEEAAARFAAQPSAEEKYAVRGTHVCRTHIASTIHHHLQVDHGNT